MDNLKIDTIRPIVYKKLAPGVAVIGKYIPPVLESDRIGLDLLDFTKQLRTHSGGVWSELDHEFYKAMLRKIAEWSDREKAAEVRCPSSIIHVSDGLSNVWHHDIPDDENLAMVLWSNREPTEILYNKQEVHADSGDVILIRNRTVLHRTPYSLSPDRFFFRRYVVTPEWL